MRHAVLTRRLQRRPIDEIHHDRVGQLLPVQVGRVREAEVGHVEDFRRTLVDVQRVGDREDQVAGFVDLDDAALPELERRYKSADWGLKWWWWRRWDLPASPGIGR